MNSCTSWSKLVQNAAKELALCCKIWSNKTIINKKAENCNIFIPLQRLCGCGVIGSRARLRIWFREECGFESLHPHHIDSTSYFISTLLSYNYHQEYKDFFENHQSDTIL